MRPLTLWILVFFTAVPAFAGPQPPDLKLSYEQFFVNMMDDPSGTARWSRNLLDHPTSDMTPADKVKLLVVYGDTCYELRCVNDPWFNEKVVREALVIAEQGSEKHLIMRLHMMLDYITSNDSDLAASLRNLDALKLKAESLGGGRILADVYREYSGVFSANNDLTKALSYMQKALKELEHDTFPGDLLQYVLEYDAGTLSSSMGDFEKARQFFKGPLEFCRREKIRHYGALIMTNLGRSLVKSNTPEQITQGLSMVDEGEALIRDLEEPMIRSYIAIVRGDAWFRRQDFTRSSQYFKEAHGLFIKAHSETWQAESAFSVAESETRLKHYAEALPWLAIFDKILGGTPTDAVRAETLRAEIMRGLGRSTEAIEALEKTLKLRDRMDKETQQSEIAKLRGQLEFTVQEQQNEMLKRDNELKTQQLQQLAAAGVVILIFFGLSVRQTKKLKTAQATIHNILEYIEEGIITIGRGFRVEASLSPYIDHLIERQPEGPGHDDVFHTLMKKIDSSEHDKQLIHDTLEACMGSNALTWELNNSHLPIEVTINQGQKILALDWRPILGRGQTIDRVLLVLRDHSLRRQLEKQLTVEQNRLLQTTTFTQEIIRARPRRVRLALDRIQEQAGHLQKLRETQDWTALARILHTFKGDARTLGLASLVTRTHALEAGVADASLWTAWQDHVQQYQKLLENFADSPGTQRAAADISLHELALEVQEGLKPHMEKHGLHLQRFCVDDSWGPAAPFDREGVRVLLLHGLTNAIDHGFILPAQSRGFKGRDVAIVVHANYQANQWRLSIQDNGAGIDREGLSKKYGEGVPLDQLILKPGITTADQATETSGRGIGLHAVQSQVQAWSGTVRLSSQGQGTRLELEWPDPMRKAGSM